MAQEPEFEAPDERVVVPCGALKGDLRAPGSKSHAFRELILSVLSPGSSSLTNVPWSADVRHGVRALIALGFKVDGAPPAGIASPAQVDLRVHGGTGALPKSSANVELGGSGTALRFMLALTALGAGPYRLDGDASLRARPVGGLLAALGGRGASIETTGGCVPVTLSGPVRGGGEVRVDASSSSQGVSALALVGCALPGGWTVHSTGPVASRGYVDLSVRCLRERGVNVQTQERADGGLTLVVPGGLPESRSVTIDGDWSSAAFLLALGPATDGRVRVDGLPKSGQPDRRILDILRAFGAQVEEHADGATASGRLSVPVDVDLGGAPDLAPLVGALGCCVAGTTRVSGAAHLRIKETDRIAAVVDAARALGCEATAHDDGFTVTGRAGGVHQRESSPEAVRIDPRGDHRLAMAFAVAGMASASGDPAGAGPVLRIGDPGCVSKSFPGFWKALARLAACRSHPARTGIVQVRRPS